jgi:hypothetical protein
MTPMERANGADAGRLSRAAIVVVGAATGIGGVIARELETHGGVERRVIRNHGVRHEQGGTNVGSE